MAPPGPTRRRRPRLVLSFENALVTSTPTVSPSIGTRLMICFVASSLPVLNSATGRIVECRPPKPARTPDRYVTSRPRRVAYAIATRAPESLHSSAGRCHSWHARAAFAAGAQVRNTRSVRLSAYPTRARFPPVCRSQAADGSGARYQETPSAYVVRNNPLLLGAACSSLL